MMQGIVNPDQPSVIEQRKVAAHGSVKLQLPTSFAVAKSASFRGDEEPEVTDAEGEVADEQSEKLDSVPSANDPDHEDYVMPRAKIKPTAKPGPYARDDPRADCTAEFVELKSLPLECDSLSEDEELGFEAVMACPHPEDWSEEFTLSEPGREEEWHLFDRDEVKMWATANGLETPTDFVFAFQSAAEIRAKLGPIAEVVWREISETEARRNVAVGWKLLCKLGEAQKLPDLPPKYTATHVQKLKKLRSSQTEQGQLEKLVGDRERPERVRQANILFDLAMTWGSPARIPSQMQQLSSLKALEFRAMEVDRIARFDHHSLAAHRLAWNNWAKWCSEQEEPEVPTEPTVVAFPMWLASQAARTSPMSLWNHFSWLHRVLGLQWKPSIEEKPKGIRGTVIAGDNQAVPPDPEILLMFEQEAELANFLPNERRPHLDFARMMWMACLRERHVQRSILVKLGTSFLWGVCPRGKSKPGFVWGMPRFTTCDADLGADLWYRWKGASINAEAALQFACVDNVGLPVKAGDAADAVRFLLAKRGVTNPELFTMRGLRRVQPTMLGQRSAPEDERVAVGDWQQCMQRSRAGVATMPVLYDGDKVRTAAFTKYIQMEILKRASISEPKKLDWRTFRARVSELDIDQVYQAAETALENDVVVDEIPSHLVPKWYQPAKQFFFPTDTVRAVKRFQDQKDEESAKTIVPLEEVVQAKAESLVPCEDVKPSRAPREDPVVNEVPCKDAMQAKAVRSPNPCLVENDDKQSLRVRLGTLPTDVCWQATRSKVHFVDGVDEPPWCSQRHGPRAKPLVRIAAMGKGVAMLQGMSLGEHVEVCVDCLAAHGY